MSWLFTEGRHPQDVEGLSDEAIATWRKLRLEAGQAEAGHDEFDPRRMLRWKGDDILTDYEWKKRRLEFHRRRLAGDPRVDTDN